MKRSDELAPLSRDHHQALFVAMKLKRAEADGAEAFLGFIAAHGGDHFRIEEEILLPAWIASDPGARVRWSASGPLTRSSTDVRNSSSRTSGGWRSSTSAIR